MRRKNRNTSTDSLLNVRVFTVEPWVLDVATGYRTSPSKLSTWLSLLRSTCGFELSPPINPIIPRIFCILRSIQHLKILQPYLTCYGGWLIYHRFQSKLIADLFSCHVFEFARARGWVFDLVCIRPNTLLSWFGWCLAVVVVAIFVSVSVSISVCCWLGLFCHSTSVLIVASLIWSYTAAKNPHLLWSS